MSMMPAVRFTWSMAGETGWRVLPGINRSGRLFVRIALLRSKIIALLQFAPVQQQVDSLALRYSQGAGHCNDEVNRDGNQLTVQG